MKVRPALFLLFLVCSLQAHDALPEDRGAAGLRQSLRRLQSTARVMHITAHPDDEDGGTLTLLSRGFGADVTLLILNRGESGANLVTGDFFDALGALRTLEILRAAQYYGVRVRFTRFIDYGYSKNVAETFRHWDREAVLADMVRIIRMEKPQVLLSRWQGTPRDGHGNHEAAGILAQLAFEAAGDPKRFPEQGLAPWQPLKLYANNRRESDDWTVRVDSGVYDPVLGRSYAQMAHDGLRHQRSQGAGSAVSRPGPRVSFYKLLASRVGMADKEAGFFERIDTSLRAYPELARHISEAAKNFSIDHPEAAVPSLAAALDLVRDDSPDPTRRIKRQQLLTALGQALGLALEARVEPDSPSAGFRPTPTFAVATPSQSFKVAVRLHGAEASDIEIVSPPGWTVRRLAADRFNVTVPAEPRYTQAYWRRDSIRESSYRIDLPEYFGRPLPPAPLRARAWYRADGRQGWIERDVESSHVDSIGVEHYRPLAAGPPVSVRFSADAGILPLGRTDYSLSCTVLSYVDGPAAGKVRLVLPTGWRSEPPEAAFSFEKEKEEANFSFRVIVPPVAAAAEHPIEAVASFNGRDYRASFTEITYPGLDSVYLSTPARHRLRVVDVKVAPGLRAGYVMGTGDDVPATLRQLGVPVDMLDRTALATADLARYNVILLGIRAYAARPDVKTYNARLLDYARNGGVLIVQYNTQEYDHNYGPYPYTMGRAAEEVSEEDSPVTILEPAHPVFNAPNKITRADFEGWVEQRGSKFWTKWDPAYTPLIETHDTGQAAQRGGWLVAKYGKGLYIYCAYAWYRQLPNAVPGAVRLFANLVSLGGR